MGFLWVKASVSENVMGGVTYLHCNSERIPCPDLSGLQGASILEEIFFESPSAKHTKIGLNFYARWHL
jgi:hypothetical protein